MSHTAKEMWAAIYPWLQTIHPKELNPIGIKELGLADGKTIADIIVVDDSALYGYEIKSSKDTLARLKSHQIKSYNTTCEYCTLITHPKYLEKATELVDEWWGVVTVDDNLYLQVHRAPNTCPQWKPHRVKSLLWKVEIKAILETLGKAKGFRSISKFKTYTRLKKVTTPDQLQELFRNALRERFIEDPTFWRVNDGFKLH